MIEMPERWSEPRKQAALRALELVGDWGVCLAREIEETLRAVGYGAGVAKRMCNDLAGLGALDVRRVHLLWNMHMNVVGMTETARADFSRYRCGDTAQQSEWEIVAGAHPGSSEKHTLGVCAAAWQMRKRGWDVEPVPVYEGLRPDLVIEREGSKPWLVEYETRSRSKMQKWRRYVYHPLLAVALTEVRADSLRAELRQAAGRRTVNWRVTSLEVLLRGGCPV